MKYICLSKFGCGSSSLATSDNSNNNSSNKKKKNSPRNIINARDAINNDVVKYIKNSLPRPSGDGSLKCFNANDINKDRKAPEKKRIRAAIHIQAIYRVLNQKLDGQTCILEKKQWPINDDVIKGLTRQEAIGYVKQLNLNNVFTREKQKKFSKRKCATDALINEQKKYVDEESS